MSINRILIGIIVAGILLVIQGFIGLSKDPVIHGGSIQPLTETCGCHGNNAGAKERAHHEELQTNPRADEKTNNTFVDPVQYQRRKTMLEECKHLGKNYSGTLPEQKIKSNMIYVEKSNLVFCDLPKVGSTFLKQVLHILAEHKHVKDPFAINGNAAHQMPFSTFKSIPYDQALWILMHSTKFLFVRNPYTRMLSGFIDKLFTNNYIFWDLTGKIIVKDHRKNPSKQSLACGHDSSFEEFLKHVIHTEIHGTNRNPHWYPMYDACRPCSFQYDVIGKIETFKEDLEKILQSKNLQDMVDISKMNQENENGAISLTVDRAYETVVAKRNCVNLPQALERAWKVLQIRGILSQLADFPYDTIKKNPNITKADFRDIIFKEIQNFPMNADDKVLSREQAIVNAYKSVPKAVMDQFHTIFHPDFVLFGFEKKLGQEHPKFHDWSPLQLNL